MKVFIYALKDPRDGHVRYVGQTSRIGARLAAHRSSAFSPGKRRSPKEKWFRDLDKVNMKPSVVVLEECDDALASDRERFWIESHRAGGRLFNRPGTIGRPRFPREVPDKIGVGMSLHPSQRQALFDASSRFGLPMSRFAIMAAAKAINDYSSLRSIDDRNRFRSIFLASKL